MPLLFHYDDEAVAVSVFLSLTMPQWFRDAYGRFRVYIATTKWGPEYGSLSHTSQSILFWFMLFGFLVRAVYGYEEKIRKVLDHTRRMIVYNLSISERHVKPASVALALGLSMFLWFPLATTVGLATAMLWARLGVDNDPSVTDVSAEDAVIHPSQVRTIMISSTMGTPLASDLDSENLAPGPVAEMATSAPVNHMPTRSTGASLSLIDANDDYVGNAFMIKGFTAGQTFLVTAAHCVVGPLDSIMYLSNGQRRMEIKIKWFNYHSDDVAFFDSSKTNLASILGVKAVEVRQLNLSVPMKLVVIRPGQPGVFTSLGQAPLPCPSASVRQVNGSVKPCKRIYETTYSSHKGDSGGTVFQGSNLVGLHCGANPDRKTNYFISLRFFAKIVMGKGKIIPPPLPPAPDVLEGEPIPEGALVPIKDQPAYRVSGPVFEHNYSADHSGSTGEAYEDDDFDVDEFTSLRGMSTKEIPERYIRAFGLEELEESADLWRSDTRAYRAMQDELLDLEEQGYAYSSPAAKALREKYYSRSHQESSSAPAQDFGWGLSIPVKIAMKADHVQQQSASPAKKTRLESPSSPDSDFLRPLPRTQPIPSIMELGMDYRRGAIYMDRWRRATFLASYAALPAPTGQGHRLTTLPLTEHGGSQLALLSLEDPRHTNCPLSRHLISLGVSVHVIRLLVTKEIRSSFESQLSLAQSLCLVELDAHARRESQRLTRPARVAAFLSYRAGIEPLAPPPPIQISSATFAIGGILPQE